MNTAQDPYDSIYMGIILTATYVLLIIAFIAWVFEIKDDIKTSAEGMASRVLRGKLSRDVSEDDKAKETELVGVGDGGENRRGSKFEAENPMFEPKSKTRPLRAPSGGLQQEPPPSSPSLAGNKLALRVNSQGLLTLGAQQAPLATSTPPTAPPPKLPKSWEAVWDPKRKQYYFSNNETGERTWNTPGE